VAIPGISLVIRFTGRNFRARANTSYQILTFGMILKVMLKPKPNHIHYIRTLRVMTEEQRLNKAFELSTMSRQLFFAGLKWRFPNKNNQEITDLYLTRIAKCYNRNY
jgi:hypothetical protein